MVCPFLEQQMRGCQKNLTLERMDAALSLCMNNYTACPLFKKQILKLRKATKARMSA